jgi:hypothetical protein
MIAVRHDVTKPFNIARYALLTLMVAQVCDLKPGDFMHESGDLHLYSNYRKCRSSVFTGIDRMFGRVFVKVGEYGAFPTLMHCTKINLEPMAAE